MAPQVIMPLTPRLRFWPWSLALVALSLVSGWQEIPGGEAATPQPRSSEGPWMQLHQRYVERARKGGVDLLFLGDSITQGWDNNPTWQRHYAPRNVANFGIGGDRTQHLLWRIDHGTLDGLDPRVVVLLIGTNNIGNCTLDEIAEGVRAILSRLRAKLPRSRVLLLGVFPRGVGFNPHSQEADPEPRVPALNERLASLADGQAVRFLDLSSTFLTAEGKIPRTLMPDFLHLSPSGYRAWAEAMEPVLRQLEHLPRLSDSPPPPTSSP